MRQVLDFAPTFNPAARTLDFTGFTLEGGFQLRKLYSVVNITRDEIIFQAGVANLGAAQAGSIITLDWNVTGHAASDVLLVEYDTSFTGKLPAAVAANAAYDARTFSDVEFQHANGTVSVTRSLDGNTFFPWPITDFNGASLNSVTAPGIYSTDGGGWLKFSADVIVRAGD